MGWLLHVLGIDTVNGPWYAFWSGAGSDLGELAIIGGLVSVYRRHNCPVRWCWRIGRHEFTDPADGVSRLLCAKHHPDVRHRRLTSEHIRQIQERRHLYLGKKPGHG